MTSADFCWFTGLSGIGLSNIAEAIRLRLGYVGGGPGNP